MTSDIKLYSPKKTTLNNVLIHTLLCFWSKTTIELGMHKDDSSTVVARVRYLNTWTNQTKSFDTIVEKNGHVLSSGNYKSLRSEIIKGLWLASKLVRFKTVLDPINPLGRSTCTINLPFSASG